MSKKAPAPDPVATANAQAQANIQAAQASASMNSPNIYTPSGSVTYQRDANGVPTSQHVNLNPTQQNIFDRQQNIADDLAEQAQTRVSGITTDPFTLSSMPHDPRGYDVAGNVTKFNPGSLPFDPTTYNDVGQYTDAVQDAYFDRSMRNLNPQFEEQRRRHEQRLSDQGLPITGEAATRATETLDRGQNEALQNASDQAVLAAGAEASRRFGMEQQVNQSAYQQSQTTHETAINDWLRQLQTEQGLRNQGIQENVLERNQNFNEAAAYLQGSPALNTPEAPTTPNYTVGAPDVMGATYQSANINQQALGSKMQGGVNLATAATPYMFPISTKGMPSSRALKHDDGDPGRILDRLKKLPVRTWRYKPHVDPRQEMHIGPYAEDWMNIMGVGNGAEISIIDVCGVLLQSVKELAEEITDLRAKVEARAA